MSSLREALEDWRTVQTDDRRPAEAERTVEHEGLAKKLRQLRAQSPTKPKVRRPARRRAGSKGRRQR
jgi:hypothetical protein